MGRVPGVWASPSESGDNSAGQKGGGAARGWGPDAGAWEEAGPRAHCPFQGMVQEEPHHTALLSKQQEWLEGSGRWTGRPIGG